MASLLRTLSGRNHKTVNYVNEIGTIKRCPPNLNEFK